MIWKILNDVVVLNNECVEQLNDGNLTEGLCVLQRAVAVVRDAAAMFNAVTPTAGIPTTMTLRSASSSVKVHQFGFRSRDWSLSKTKASPVSDSLSMHGQPLLLYITSTEAFPDGSNAHHLSTEKDDSVVFTLFSAAILFNLALVCHRLGMVHGRDSSVIRASKLYMVIVELLNDTSSSTIEEGLTMSKSRSSTQFFLLSLALNNLGHVQYELCNYTGYHRCMITLRNLMSNAAINDCTNDMGPSAGSDDSMMAGILDEIRLNILFWNFSPPSVAHAA